MNFYIADTHFGHENIIRLCNRPFSSVEQMNRIMADNWNDKVSNTDTVYIVGDFAFKSATDTVEILKALTGKKILIVGNHDVKNLKNNEFRKCFQDIQQLAVVEDGGRRIQLCHYPIVEWASYFRGSYLIYGHIHNNTQNRAYKVMKSEERALNAGAEIVNYTPVTFDELVELNTEFERLH